jgi:alcohol dehydrogenase class IV
MPSFVVPTETVYGWGCAAEVGPRARQAGFSRALVVTDQGVRGAGLTQAVEASLRAAGIAFEVYDAISSNPRDTEAEACARAIAETRAGLLVAIGGGRVIDAAKAAGLVCVNGGRVRDWIPLMGGQPAAQPGLSLYALPTTTGTGSEISGGAVITFDFGSDGGARKGGVGNCQPALAFLDPELVVHLPAGLLAASGLDALTHAVESYVSTGATIFSRTFSAQAIRVLAGSLAPAVAAARSTGAGRGPTMEAMLYAANLAGRSMMGRLGQVHGMSHVVSAHFDTPHGYTNAVLLTAVLEQHAGLLGETLAEVGYLMGDPACAPGVNPAAGARRAIDAIARLREQSGAPGRLRDLGVPRDALARLAADVATLDPRQNPGPATEADFVTMFERAW